MSKAVETFGSAVWRMIVFIIATLIGNWLGDQATIRDCATKGEAVMMGSAKVKIKCEVHRVLPVEAK